MGDHEGRLFNGCIKESDGNTHVHEGGLLVVEIAQSLKRHEKVEKFISVWGGVYHGRPKGLRYYGDGQFFLES